MIRLSILTLGLCFLLVYCKDESYSRFSFKQRINSYKTDNIIRFNFYNKIINIKIKGSPKTSPIVFIALHNDETTGQQVVSTYLKNNNLAFIQIENNKYRLIRFTHLNKSYAFNPNNIFG